MGREIGVQDEFTQMGRLLGRQFAQATSDASVW